MTRNGALLRRIGEALFGPHWLNPLSDLLGVNPRTVRRWRDNEFIIPDDVWTRLSRLCWTRAKKLEDLATELNPLICMD